MTATDLSKTRLVYLTLRDKIMRGQFGEARALPGEQKLAAAFDVSRVTLRRALAALKAEGLITRRRGSGTFVAERGEAAPLVVDFADVMPQLVAMGRATQVDVLAFAYGPAPPDAAEALRLDAGALVQCCTRTRRIDGSPFSHLTTCVPEDIGRTFTRDDLAVWPLLELLERSGLVASHARQHVSAALAAPEVAQALACEVGAPLISLVRTVFDARGRGVEHLRALYRPDRYAFRMEFVRRGAHADRRWEPARRAELTH